MTIRRFGIALAVLSLGYGCAEAVSLKDGETNGGSGGSTATTGGATGNGGSSSTPTGGTTGTKTSPPGTTPANGGSTGSTTATTPAGGSTGTTTTTKPTPTSCGTTSGELAVTHAAQSGGSGVTGTTTITPGTATSFNADAVKLKFCFYTIGDVPATLATATDAMKIYNADVGGMPAYTSLSSAKISVETVASSQACYTFDFTSVAAAAGVVVSGAGKVNCNWSFDSSKITGMSMDTRPGHELQLIVLYNDAVAACTTI